MTAIDTSHAAPTAQQSTRSVPPTGPGIGRWMTSLVLAGLLLFSIPVTLIAIFANRGSSVGTEVGADRVVEVSLSEFAINGDLTVEPGTVTLRIVNDGAIVHNLVIAELGLRTPDIAPGRSFDLELGQPAERTYEVFCDIAGHQAAGMVSELTVGEGIIHTGHDHAGGIDPDEVATMEQNMVQSMLAFPAESEGRGNAILEPAILADGTKQFDLTAAVTPWEVSPGEFVDAWTYNGIVPGPQIIVEIGDRVQVVLHNETPLLTDIHWHGVQTPNDQDGVSPFTQDPIMPGETFTYEFSAVSPAIGMYHAHMHSQVSVLNGLFATFIIGDRPYPVGRTISGVEIPADLVIAQELPMVLNDAGVIGLTLNGKSFPATEPLATTVGDWVSVHYYNEGLTPHPMHLHQFKQLVYAKDGVALEEPYWADTINVAPGERYSVIFQTTDPGVWVWHCHILTHVENSDGMFEMVTALIVSEPDA